MRNGIYWAGMALVFGLLVIAAGAGCSVDEPAECATIPVSEVQAEISATSNQHIIIVGSEPGPQPAEASAMPWDDPERSVPWLPGVRVYWESNTRDRRLTEGLLEAVDADYIHIVQSQYYDEAYTVNEMQIAWDMVNAAWYTATDSALSRPEE